MSTASDSRIQPSKFKQWILMRHSLGCAKFVALIVFLIERAEQTMAKKGVKYKITNNRSITVWY